MFNEHFLLYGVFGHITGVFRCWFIFAVWLSVADDNLPCVIHLLFSDIHYMEITTAHCIMLLPLIPFSAVDFVSR